MPFVGPEVTIKKRHGARLWRLAHAISYRGERETWTVPKDFETDLGSVPWWGTWLIPKDQQVSAFIVHDFAYSSGVVPRRDADGLMRRIMRELGASAPRRWSAWAGVRLGGWWAWRKHRGRSH